MQKYKQKKVRLLENVDCKQTTLLNMCTCGMPAFCFPFYLLKDTDHFHYNAINERSLIYNLITYYIRIFCENQINTFNQLIHFHYFISIFYQDTIVYFYILPVTNPIITMKRDVFTKNSILLYMINKLNVVFIKLTISSQPRQLFLVYCNKKVYLKQLFHIGMSKQAQLQKLIAIKTSLLSK